jgi:transposase
MIDHLVFLDESGINVDLSRHYGRSVGKTRVVDHVPLNKPQTITILSSMRYNGEKAFVEYKGGTTGERFVTYLKDTLLPSLEPDDIVVMDNLRSHHVKAVEEVIRTAGMIPLYLPPYSPDLNPIEKMWSKAKAILREMKIRSQSLLEAAIGGVLALVTPSDCQHWFASSNYCS